MLSLTALLLTLLHALTLGPLRSAAPSDGAVRVHAERGYSERGYSERSLRELPSTRREAPRADAQHRRRSKGVRGPVLTHRAVIARLALARGASASTPTGHTTTASLHTGRSIFPTLHRHHALARHALARHARARLGARPGDGAVPYFPIAPPSTN